MRAPDQSCFVMPTIRKTTLTITIMNRIINQVNPAMPRSKLVRTGALPSFSEIDPKWVRRPVLTTTAFAAPLTTLLP